MDIEGGKLGILECPQFARFEFKFMSIERIWNFPKIKILCEGLGFNNIWSDISGYESWWLRDV
jgi:hypothetical protein